MEVVGLQVELLGEVCGVCQHPVQPSLATVDGENAQTGRGGGSRGDQHRLTNLLSAPNVFNKNRYQHLCGWGFL